MSRCRSRPRFSLGFRWIRAAGISEPLPHYSLFLVYSGRIIDPILVTFLQIIFLLSKSRKSATIENAWKEDPIIRATHPAYPPGFYVTKAIQYAKAICQMQRTRECSQNTAVHARSRGHNDTWFQARAPLIISVALRDEGQCLKWCFPKWWH